MNLPVRPSLPRGLYALCDDTFRPELPLIEKARLLVLGGAPTLQVRLKRTPVREALAALRSIVSLCRSAGAVCLVNDRVDWALLADADGVHLGEEDLPIEEARRLLGPDRLIGGTVRDLAGVERARLLGADYVGLGPLFGTTTKQVAAPVLGLDAFREVTRASPLPVVGIGGVTLERIGSVAAAGAHSAAIVSDALSAPDIPARVRTLIASFERGLAQRSVWGL